MSTQLSNQDGTNAYERIDQHEIEALRREHAWIVNPIYRASDSVLDMPFFHWLRSLTSPHAFGDAAKQLYHHSATFPKVMGLMLGLTSMNDNSLMPFYAKHAYGEADHHMLITDWMLTHGIIKSPDELRHVICTVETNACVNYAYQMALEQDREGWLVGLNSGIERCSNDFFKVASPKMHSLGAGHEYFDVHVGADEHHSIMGLAYLKSYDSSSRDGVRLIAKALEGISLWAAMLHSWIGLDVHPRFNLDGSLMVPKALP
jgi:hypothetical protein